MNYVISAVLGGWILFSLILSGVGPQVWAVTFVVALLIAAWFIIDSRCPKCGRLNALAKADEGPGIGKNVRQVHFQCHHCGHKLSRRAPLARQSGGKSSRSA